MDKQRLMELAGINEAVYAGTDSVFVIATPYDIEDYDMMIIGPFNENNAKKFIKTANPLIEDLFDLSIGTPSTPQEGMSHFRALGGVENEYE